MRRITLAAFAAVLLLAGVTLTADAAPHPTDSRGYVTDGTPQNDDAHCVGSTRQRVACLVARRPQCPGWARPMDRPTAWDCWAPAINVYDWNPDAMMAALYCESKGETGATNGRYIGLLQDDGGSYDPVQAFEHAYYAKWVPAGGSSPWAGTYGRYCAD